MAYIHEEVMHPDFQDLRLVTRHRSRGCRGAIASFKQVAADSLHGPIYRSAFGVGWDDLGFRHCALFTPIQIFAVDHVQPRSLVQPIPIEWQHPLPLFRT